MNIHERLQVFFYLFPSLLIFSLNLVEFFGPRIFIRSVN
jgi:hypothetical protein